MSNGRSHLRSLFWSEERGRVRAVWCVLVPVVVGFLALQLTGAAASTRDLNRGEMMLVSFGGTTLVMLAILGIASRYLDHRPVREYGYRLSWDWWIDLVVGTGVGALIVAITFVIALYTDSLQVTSSALIPDAGSLGRLLVFFTAFVGVAFYEEYIYRGSFISNAIEGLSARGITHPVATAVAVFASTLAFAFIHLPGAIAADANVGLVIIKTGLFGGLLGVAYLLTEELAFPMGLHLGVNYALMNIFGIGAEETPGIPTLVTVEHTATGLWSPARGIPLLVAILIGYGLTIAWTRWRQKNRTDQQLISLTHSRSNQ